MANLNVGDVIEIMWHGKIQKVEIIGFKDGILQIKKCKSQ